MDAKTVVISLLSLIFGVAAIIGLWSAGEGYLKFVEGQKIDNDMVKEQGRKMMLYGLLQAGGMAGFLAAITAAINALNF